MEISFFEKTFRGPQLLTKGIFESVIADATLNAHYKNIFKAEEEEVRLKLINDLPSITWQASFDEEEQAMPSGLFVLDVKGINSWGMFYRSKVKGKEKRLGIVYAAMNPRTNGLTLVAKCRPTLHTLYECQTWLANILKVPSSADETIGWDYKVPFVADDFVLYYDSLSIFELTPLNGAVYVGGKNLVQLEPDPEVPEVVQAVLLTKNANGDVNILTFGTTEQTNDITRFVNTFKSTFNIQ